MERMKREREKKKNAWNDKYLVLHDSGLSLIFLFYVLLFLHSIFNALIYLFSSFLFFF